MTQEDVHFVDKSAESEVGSPADSAVSVPTLSEPGLLVMDVDSTLIDEEVTDIPFVAQMPASRHRAGSTGLQINNCR